MSDLCFFAAVETSATRSRSMADCVDAEDCSCGSKMAPAEHLEEDALAAHPPAADDAMPTAASEEETVEDEVALVQFGSLVVPKFHIPNPKPLTLNPKPQTLDLNPKPSTPNPKP